MANEIDPSCPAPTAVSPCEINPAWLPPRPETRDLTAGALPATVPTPEPPGPVLGGQRRQRAAWPIIASAAAVGLAVGAGVTFVLTQSSKSNQGSAPLTAPALPAAPSAVTAPGAPTGLPTVSPPAVSPPAAAAAMLHPNSGPDVLVRTVSGRTRCVISQTEIVCEASGPAEQGNNGFLQAPTEHGAHWHLANVTAVGGFRWANGNIPGAYPENDYVLNYQQSYSAQGWTISASRDGTTFTNDRTGHGMFVAIENVRPF